jgi:hypothetical protein
VAQGIRWEEVDHEITGSKLSQHIAFIMFCSVSVLSFSLENEDVAHIAYLIISLLS